MKGCLRCIRVIVILLNILLAILGLAIIAGAVYVHMNYEAQQILQSTGYHFQFQIVLYILMAVGGLMLATSIFGCCGAFRESACLLGTCFMLLVLITSAHGIGFAYDFIYKEQVMKSVEDRLAQGVDEYRTTNGQQGPYFIETIQKMAKCCGVDTASEYEAKLPDSCCKRSSIVCSQRDGIDENEIYSVIIGLVLLGGAVYVYKEHEAQNIVQSTGYHPQIQIVLYILMTVGGLLFVTSLFGCCGGIRESSCLLGTYFVLLFIVFAAHVTGAIIGYTYRKELMGKIDDQLITGVAEYQTIRGQQEPHYMDTIQKMAQCCGVDSASEYGGNIPASCCKSASIDCRQDRPIDINDAYLDGCRKNYKPMAHKLMMALFLANIAIAGFEIIGLTILGFSIYLYLDHDAQNMVRSTGCYLQFQIAIYVLMAIGGLTLIISLIGCCGAFHESQYLLGTYFIVLLIIFSIHVTGAVIGYIYRNEIMDKVDAQLSVGVDEYRMSREQRQQWTPFMDSVQPMFHCCGADGPDEYRGNIPVSCCRRDKTNCYQDRIDINDVFPDIFCLLFSLVMCCTVRQYHSDYYGVDYSIST